MPKITKPQQIISAAEVGEYAYCAKAWHLHKHGAQPQGKQLAQGTAFHQAHSRRRNHSALLFGLAALLIILAVLLIALAQIR